MFQKPFTIIGDIVIEKGDPSTVRESKMADGMSELLKTKRPLTDTELRFTLGGISASTFNTLKKDYIKYDEATKNTILLDKDSKKWYSTENTQPNHGLPNPPATGSVDRRRIEKIYTYLNAHGETTLSDLCCVTEGMSQQTMRNLKRHILDDTFWSSRIMYNSTNKTMMTKESIKNLI